MRDEAIEQQHKQDEALNTAAHLRMEQQIVRIGTWSEADDDKVREEFAKADSELQAQIDAIDTPTFGQKAGSLNWVDYTFTGDTVDALSKQARIHPERTKMALNKDLIEGGHRQWTTLFEPYPSVIGMELKGKMHRVVVESTGQTGQNSRSHCFKILEHDLPKEAQDPAALVAIYPDYSDPTIDLSQYATKEDVEAATADYLPLSGGEMTGPAVLKVNHIEPVNTPMIQYNGDPNSTHAAGLINRYMMTNYVTEELAKVSSGSPELPKFKLMSGSFEEFKAGDFAALDVSGEHTREISKTRSIVFSGVDMDGNRSGRDRDAIEYSRTFSSGISVLLQNGDKTIMSMSPSHNALCELYYLPDWEGTMYDMYVITWQSPTSSAQTSDTAVWNNGVTYRLHIPEIFF
jgi:hypothetical protein